MRGWDARNLELAAVVRLAVADDFGGKRVAGLDF